MLSKAARWLAQRTAGFYGEDNKPVRSFRNEPTSSRPREQTGRSAEGELPQSKKRIKDDIFCVSNKGGKQHELKVRGFRRSVVFFFGWLKEWRAHFILREIHRSNSRGEREAWTVEKIIKLPMVHRSRETVLRGYFWRSRDNRQRKARSLSDSHVRLSPGSP